MKQKLFGIQMAILIGAGILALTGCTKEGAITVSDEDIIQTLIQEDFAPWFEFTEIYQGDSTDEGSYQLQGMPSDTFAYVIAWWRRITDLSRTVEITIHNDTANVTLTREITGVLNLIVTNDTFPPDSVVHLTKPLHDTGTRYARFVRTGPPSAPHRGWTLDAISDVEIHSDNPTIVIDSLRIQGGTYDTVVTNPLSLRSREDVFAFAPGTPVTVTAYVSNPPEAVVYLHYNNAMHMHHRSRFTYLPEEGVFVGTWTTPALPGVYHAGVDVLRIATLKTDDYPYDSNGWFFVYRVVATP